MLKKLSNKIPKKIEPEEENMSKPTANLYSGVLFIAT